MARKAPTTRRATGTRRGLCVGINDYPYEGNDLNGCVNDARGWAEALTGTFGFPAADVRVVLDAEATKRNVLDAVKDLLAGARAGDVLAFTNSSHGSYVAENDGDEETYDEVVCPYDIDDNHILDDELRELFSALPSGVHATVVLDNCFSGTGTRAALADLIPGHRTPDDRRIRFLSPALRGLKILHDPFRARPRRRSKHPQSAMKEVLLAGCTDHQYSYDAYFSGIYHGAMTYYALQAIREATHPLTYTQLHQRLNHLISEYPQNPQLEGASANKRRPIFT